MRLRTSCELQWGKTPRRMALAFVVWGAIGCSGAATSNELFVVDGAALPEAMPPVGDAGADTTMGGRDGDSGDMPPDGAIVGTDADASGPGDRDSGDAGEDGGQDGGEASVPTEAGGFDGSWESGGAVHPSDWMAKGSSSFHGSAAKKGLDSCTSCHGADLNGGIGVSCNTCHSGWKTNCTFCHGGKDGTSGAPPWDVERRESTTEIGVGAHTSHITMPSGMAKAMECSGCHPMPTDAQSAGHIDPSPAELVWGALAKTGNAQPSWDRSARTCSNVYCHGEFSGGEGSNSPIWTSVGTGGAACGTCHGISPRTGRHPSQFSKHAFMGKDCTYCHDGITNSGGDAISSVDLHINGVKDVKLRNGGTFSGGRCSDTGCHGRERW